MTHPGNGVLHRLAQGGNDDAAAAAKPWPALVPPTGPPQAPQPPAAPSQQHDGALTPADLGLEPPAPWALDFTPPALSLHAHHHAGDWQPKAPATYQAAMHRQRRLQHGRARRAFLHLHRFVGEAVLHIIAAARQHGAATAGRPAAAVAAPAPAPAALTQGFAAPAAAAELVRGEVQVVASVAVPAANWLSTQSMATGPQRPRHHQQQQPLPHYAAPRSMARPRPQAAPQQDRLQQRPSQQQQQLQQRPSQQQQQQQLQQRPSLDGGGGGGAALASRASLPDTPVVLLAPPPLPRGAPPPSALQPRDSGGASPTAARHLATTAGGRSFAASSSLKRASDEGGGEAAAGSIRASYTGDAVATVHGRRGSEVGEKLPLQLERRRSKPLGSRDSAAADAAGAVAVPPGVVLSPRAIAEGAESFGTPASKGLPHRQQQQQQQQHVQPRQRGAYITNLAAAAPRSTSQHLSTTLLHPPVPAPPLLAPPPAAIHGAAPPPPHGAEPHAARSTASSSGGGSSASAWPRRPQRRVHPTAPPAPPAPPTTTRPAPPPPPATTITCTARRHAPPAVTSASCFADALLRCADPASREPLRESLAKDPLYAGFALPAAPDDQPPPRPSDDGAPSPPPLTPITSRGPLGSLPTVAAHAQTLQAEADAGEFGGLGAAPVAAVVLALEHLMGRLTATAPAVSDATLRCARCAANRGESLALLRHGWSRLITNNRRCRLCRTARRDHYEDLPFHQAADTGEAARLLGGLPADDQELLLLFSALLRHAAVASGGPGCEEHVKGLVGWVLRLLLGPQAERPGALASQEAMACLLWYLVRNDAAFAALVVARQQRVGGDGAGGWMGSVCQAAGSQAVPCRQGLARVPLAWLQAQAAARRPPWRCARTVRRRSACHPRATTRTPWLAGTCLCRASCSPLLVSCCRCLSSPNECSLFPAYDITLSVNLATWCAGGAADGSMMQRGGGLPAALAAHSRKAAPQQRHLVAAAGGSGPRATAGGRQAIEWVPGGHLPPRAPSAAGEAPGRHSHGTAGEQQEEQEQEQEQEERRRQATHNGCMSETTALTEQQLWPHDVWV